MYTLRKKTHMVKLKHIELNKPMLFGWGRRNVYFIDGRPVTHSEFLRTEARLRGDRSYGWASRTWTDRKNGNTRDHLEIVFSKKV